MSLSSSLGSFFFRGTGDRTQDCILAEQMLMPLSKIPCSHCEDLLQEAGRKLGVLYNM